MPMRHLHDPAREHVTSVKQRIMSSAFGKQYLAQHPNDSPKIGFRILAGHHDILCLHIEEAMARKQLKLELNRRQEELGTGFYYKITPTLQKLTCGLVYIHT